MTASRILAVAAAGLTVANTPVAAAPPELSKTQTLYNYAACPSDRPARALDKARRLTDDFTDPQAYRQFVLKLAAHGVPRHAHHAAPSYIAVVEKRQGIEASEELVFAHFCSAVTEFSDYVSYVAAGGEASADLPGDTADYQPAALRTVDVTRFDATRCEDPAVFAALERAAQNQLYNPQVMVDPPGVHYLRAVMDSALLGITTYADSRGRAHEAGGQFGAFCETVKTASEALLSAQQDYNAEMGGEQAQRARENQSLGLEAIKQKGLREEAEEAERRDYEAPASP